MVLVSKKQKTPPLHHRKRQAQHHKRDKSYEKSYWPYLPLLGIIGIGFVFNLLWAPLSHSVLDYATNTSPSGLLIATNAQRSVSGEAGLQLNTQLSAAAQAKANDMATRNYWSHNTPDGAEPWTFVSKAGYGYLALGENLAYGFDSSDTTLTGWMNSPGHRANILNNGYQEVGFGIANASDYQDTGPETIVVAFYGKPTGKIVSAAVPPIGSSNPTAPAKPTPIQSAPVATLPSATPEPIATTAPEVKSQSTPELTAAPQRITRLEAASVTLPVWSVSLVSFIIVAGTLLFLVRHARFLHKAIIKGEKFVVTHPALDFAVVAVVMVGLVLTRTAGFIN